MSNKLGPCVKQEVIAVIVNRGKYWIGSNYCKNAQDICPRGSMPSGVGYELCRDICNQTAHAEVNACYSAGDEAKGGTLYLVGHTHCCDNCKMVMREFGIRRVLIGYLPKGIRIAYGDNKLPYVVKV